MSASRVLTWHLPAVSHAQLLDVYEYVKNSPSTSGQVPRSPGHSRFSQEGSAAGAARLPSTASLTGPPVAASPTRSRQHSLYGTSARPPDEQAWTAQPHSGPPTEVPAPASWPGLAGSQTSSLPAKQAPAVPTQQNRRRPPAALPTSQLDVQGRDAMLSLQVAGLAVGGLPSPARPPAKRGLFEVEGICSPMKGSRALPR